MPFRTTVDQVVQHFTANESVSYLSHALGLTAETHIVFVEVSPVETAIRVRMNLVGKVSRALGFAIEPVVLNNTKRSFDDFCRESEGDSRDAASQP